MPSSLLYKKSHLPSVCIGGVGGSGTRVYAQILQKLGVNLGTELNESYDNLLFTRFFKNPIWYSKKSDTDFKKRLDYFVCLMNGNDLSKSEKDKILKVFLGNECYKLSGDFDFQRMVNRRISLPWGWKEPNSHIYIKELAEALPQLKYILIIRDGFDMSFSSNIQQLTNWGNLLFDISISDNEIEIFKAQLEYWIKINLRSIQLGNKYLGERFLISRFKDIYTTPEKEIKRIADFLNIELSSSNLKAISQIPKSPKTINRYKSNLLKLDANTIKLVNEINSGKISEDANYSMT